MTAAASIKEVQRDFSRAATTYDAYATLQREVLEEALLLLAPCLGSEALLLDAGCGTGRALEIAKPAVPTRDIIGVDIALPMCARAAMHGMPAACSDIQRLPIANCCIDAVICSLVMQWVGQRSLAFSEFFRVVQPGGYAALAILGNRTLEELRSVLGAERVHSFPSLQVLMEEAGQDGWGIERAFSRCITQNYASLSVLMESLKAIGAANKLPGRKRGLSTLSFFRRAAQLYHAHFSSPQGIYASWEVHYLLLKKP